MEVVGETLKKVGKEGKVGFGGKLAGVREKPLKAEQARTTEQNLKKVFHPTAIPKPSRWKTFWAKAPLSSPLVLVLGSRRRRYNMSV